MDWFEKLRIMKYDSKMTTNEIAIKSNVPEPTLEKLFSGQTKDPKLSTIVAVVHCLGHTLDDLAPISNAKNTPLTSSEGVSSEAMEVACAYDEATLKDKNTARMALNLPLIEEEQSYVKKMA